MSANRDVNRIVRSWLDEGVTVLPDRVLDAVLDQLPATNQRRATWWPARRYPTMSKFVGIGVAAAAIVVAAVIGYRLVGGDSGFGPTPVSTPTPIPSASSPPVTSLTYTSTAQDLEPGMYRIPAGAWTPADLTFTVPAGWQAQYLGFSKHLDQPNEMGLVPFIVTHVYTDTCAPEGEFELAPIGPSVDDLANALEALGGAEVSPAEDMTVDEYPAKRVDLAFSEDIALADCRVPALQIWANASETDFFSVLPGSVASVYIVDVQGQTLAMVATWRNSPSESDVAELEAMVDSVQIEP